MRLIKGDYLSRLIDDLTQGKTNPHAAALEIIRRLAKELSRLEDSGKAKTA